MENFEGVLGAVELRMQDGSGTLLSKRLHEGHRFFGEDEGVVASLDYEEGRRLGMDSGDGWVEVVEGLEAGEEIVLSSHFLIDSESSLQEAIEKLLAPPHSAGQGEE